MARKLSTNATNLNMNIYEKHFHENRNYEASYKVSATPFMTIV